MLIEKIKKGFFDEIKAYGGSLIYIFTIITLALLSHKETFLRLFIGYILMWIIVFSIRLIYFKQRPDKQKISSFFDRIYESSFPSLDSARVVFFSFIMGNFFQNKYLFIFFLLIALLVGYTRVYMKKHYAIDVIAGFIIGYLSYLLVIPVY